ncbi:hypothetical protein HK405_002899 [Cladochytrium tenue]|nr:hypothetical protein HK405_002899 [Cladochytrium tenue]
MDATAITAADAAVDDAATATASVDLPELAAATSSSSAGAALPVSEDQKEEEEVNRADYVRVPLTRTEFFLVFLALMMSALLAALDQTIVSTALETIVTQLGKQDLIPWVGSAYLLTAASLCLVFGKAADIFGRKWVLVFIIVVFEIGSVICGSAQSMEMLIVGRAVAGMGQYQGLFGAVFGLASVLGPVIGGAFSDNGLWRWCFYVNVPIGAIAVIVVIICLRFPSPPGTIREKIHQIDTLGVITIAAAVVCFLTPLQLGGSTWAWNAPQTIALFVVSPFLFGLFAFVELRVAKTPMVSKTIFTNRSVPILLGVSFSLGAAFISAIYYAGLYFQVDYGTSATMAGIRILPLVLGVVSTSIISGLINSRTGRYLVFILASGIVATGGLVAVSFLNKDSSLGLQIVFLLILGIGIGMALQMRVIALQASVNLDGIAMASAAAMFFNTLGGAVGVAITGTVMQNVIDSSASSKPVLTSVVKMLSTLPELSGYDVDPSQTVLLRNILTRPEVQANIPNATEALSELIDAFSDGFSSAMRVAILFSGLVFLLGLFVHEYRHVGAKPAAHGAADPETASPKAAAKAADPEFLGA